MEIEETLKTFQQELEMKARKELNSIEANNKWELEKVKDQLVNQEEILKKQPGEEDAKTKLAVTEAKCLAVTVEELQQKLDLEFFVQIIWNRL